MLWRAWVLIAGVPLGLLAALAAFDAPGPVLLVLCAAGGGLLVLGAASLLARVWDDEPERGRHLALAASTALVALPALGLVVLGLAPGPRVLLALCVLALAVALWLGARRRGSAGGLGRGIGIVIAVVAIGDLALTALSATVVAVSNDPMPPTPNRAEAIYDVDARVATVPLPECRPDGARVRVLLERGAHPLLPAEGPHLWFDATAEDGTRQVHRFDRASGDVRCWTCDEPGNNFRPAPNPRGARVVFTTDRHASWRHPFNTDLQLIQGLGDAPRTASRRLTFSEASDDFAGFTPGSGSIVWSHGKGGRYAVAAAGVSSGHGGLVMAAPRPYVARRSAFVAPLGWSPDARTLVYAAGNPYGIVDAVAVDPATGEERVLARNVAWTAGASFNADGGFVAVAGAQRATALGLVPDFLGFMLGGMAAAATVERPLFSGTQVRVGATSGELFAVDLGEDGAWGAPTGIAVEPSGTAFVLGQRRTTEAGVEERIVQVSLACEL